MRTAYHGLLPPYTLPSNIVYFHDWRYVCYGACAWLGPDGERVPMMGPGKVPAMHYEYRDVPLGVHLAAQPARKSEPVLTAASTRDVCLFGGSVIKEDGVYRLWYENWLREDFETGRAGTFNALRYAESADGMRWKLPKVGSAKLKGDRNRNVVYGATLTPDTGFHGGSVFKDPSAPKRERYKAFHYGRITPRALAAYRRRRPNDVDVMIEHHMRTRKFGSALYGAASPDGIQWKAVRGALLVQNSDTHNICSYDSILGKYVAYIRTWYFQRRTIGRTVSDDFRDFSFPEEVFWPDAGQAPYDSWYANGMTTMPGAPDYRIMFPMRWRLTTDRFELHLAASPDNVVWGFVPGGAVCTPGQPDEWDAEGVSPSHGMVELPGDRIGILYNGASIPHKYPRRPPLGGVGWAWWPKGRLVALKAAEEGSFALWPLIFDGRTVRLNFRTAMTGYVRVEALDGEGDIIPGRSFADCVPLVGDHLDRLVTWRGQSDLGHTNGQPVTLRFQIRNADLFSVAFR